MEKSTGNTEKVENFNIKLEKLSNQEIYKWFNTTKFQKERGEQEYTMIYELDLPKIIRAFLEQNKENEK